MKNQREKEAKNPKFLSLIFATLNNNRLLKTRWREITRNWRNVKKPLTKFRTVSSVLIRHFPITYFLSINLSPLKTLENKFLIKNILMKILIRIIIRISNINITLINRSLENLIVKITSILLVVTNRSNISPFKIVIIVYNNNKSCRNIDNSPILNTKLQTIRIKILLNKFPKVKCTKNNNNNSLSYRLLEPCF